MMGPVVSAEHRDHIERLVKKGIDEGAKLVLGGKRPTQPPMNKGYYVVPTLYRRNAGNGVIPGKKFLGRWPVSLNTPMKIKSSIWPMIILSAFRFGLDEERCKGIRFCQCD